MCCLVALCVDVLDYCVDALLFDLLFVWSVVLLLVCVLCCSFGYLF